MDEMYFTIAGCNHYFSNGFIEKEQLKEAVKKYE